MLTLHHRRSDVVIIDVALTVKERAGTTGSHLEFIVKARIVSYGWEQLRRTLYSPDLAPSEFHLFMH